MRDRVRRAIRRASRSPAGSPRRAAEFARELGPAPLAREDHTVTRLLFERLSERDVAEVERRAAEVPELASLAAADSTARPGLVLAYGMWLELPRIAAQTGLSPVQPPEEIHAMARGPLAAAGGVYEADLIADSLLSAGASIEGMTRALDFGCSSGRVVRVLAAAHPEVTWMGCDPNEAAIGWARANLPAIDFFVSPQHPPLDIESGALDLVYAISIWSHFEPDLGLRWFDEMHRLIRSGGHLVCTTHGLQSLALYATSGVRSPEQSQEIADALYRRGWWYAPEFGAGGDWGVVNPAWGMAFISAEWLLTKLAPRWRVAEFAPGRNQSNQDVYVLERA